MYIIQILLYFGCLLKELKGGILVHGIKGILHQQKYEKNERLT